LYPHAGGHVDLIANAAELGPVIEMFRNMHAYSVDIPRLRTWPMARTSATTNP
jgi:hypothetical protein